MIPHTDPHSPRVAKPGAPLKAPEVLEVGPKFCELSWQPPATDGGSPITGYIVEKADLSGKYIILGLRKPNSLPYKGKEKKIFAYHLWIII